MKKFKKIAVAVAALVLIAALVFVVILFAKKDIAIENSEIVENTISENNTIVENTIEEATVENTVKSTTGVNIGDDTPIATGYTDKNIVKATAVGGNVSDFTSSEEAEKAMEAENAAIADALTEDVNVKEISAEGAEQSIVVVNKKEETTAPAEVAPATPEYGEATLTTEDKKFEEVPAQPSTPIIEEPVQPVAPAEETPVVETEIANDEALEALLNATM